jgi:hypothetical protein
MDEQIPMSVITLAQAQSKLDALMAATESASLSVRYADRQVTYRAASEIIDLINFWERKVKQLTRAATGLRGPSVRLADFR